MRQQHVEYWWGKRWTWLVLAAGLVIGPVGQSWAPYDHAVDDPLELQKSPVYHVYGDYAIRGMKVHRASLREMLGTGLRKLTGEEDLGAAWRHFIHEDDVVALVFTEHGGLELGTNTEMARALLESLYASGFRRENIMLVGLRSLPKEAEGTRPWHYGWQEQSVDFNLAEDHLASWLAEVTAIINVPSVMDDNISGLRCAMTNLSLGVVKNPGRLYVNASDPFVPMVYQLPEIRGKVRLHIANALRILYYGGPKVDQTYVFEQSGLLFGTDVVALDTVALYLIRRARRTMMMPADVTDELTAPYLDTACSMGLGYSDLNFIEYHKVKHDKW